MSKQTHYQVCFNLDQGLKPYLVPWTSPNAGAVGMWLKSFGSQTEAEQNPHEHEDVYLHFETIEDYFRYCEKLLSSLQILYSPFPIKVQSDFMQLHRSLKEIEDYIKEKENSHE